MDPQRNEELKALLREISDRTRSFDPPPDGFDPLTASPDELRRHGFPPRPDRRIQPEQYAFWSRLFSRQLTFVRAQLSFQPPLYRLNHRAARAAATTRHQSSMNWSGGYITPKHGRMFTQVHGEWDVPMLLPPAGAPANAEYRCSTWIGLDGQRRYLHSSLPQIGTSQFIELVNGQPTYTYQAWWQWWLRGHHNPVAVLHDLQVNPGDRILASIYVLDRTTVLALIMNATTGHITFVLGIAPQATMPHAPAQVQVMISGATAEWVTERPTVWLDDELYDLPDYDAVTFDCRAVSALDPSSPGRVEKLAGARFIHMFERRTNPHRTRTISESRWVSNQQIQTAFR
jgi:hypothetical protein